MVRIAVPDFLAGDHGVDLAFLLGWSRVLSGHFSPVEIAMTLVIGVGFRIRNRDEFRLPDRDPPVGRGGPFGVIAALQLIAFRVSILPAIAYQ